MLVLTVNQINRYVKAVLEENSKLSDLYIKGEISNFTHHYRSGHFYFSLKDEKSVIKAVMFKNSAESLPFLPENGMMVILRASLGVYERDGAYQLYVTDMQPDGAGALAIAFEQMKAKLSDEGLFDEKYKKDIPLYPKKIGVVTSESGAAIQDIINVIGRRYPLAKLVLAHSAVQGREADRSLVTALERLDGNCDVMIIARGGGSAEDLQCFNSEMLARAIFMAKTPIISAVGHETDYTICDFAADVRAPTPSAAAEIAVPSLERIKKRITESGEYLEKRAYSMLFSLNQQLDTLASHPALKKPMWTLNKKQEKMDFLSEKLYNNKDRLITEYYKQLGQRSLLLDSLSPLRVFDRGYSAVFKDNEAVRTVSGLQKGDIVTIRMKNGEAEAAVTKIK